jgi:tetratricopeptide (TPR) repeat protein
MIVEFALAWTICAGASARENEKGLRAWGAKDTAGAIKHLEKAARDTSDPRYGYNLGTVKALAGKPDAENAFERSLQGAKNPDQRAKILYNRGTSRLAAAKSGKGDPSGAVQDFRDALKLRPGWQEAARNLELAMRMEKRDQQRKKQDDRKNQDQKKDQDKKSQPKPQDSKSDGKEPPQQPQPKPGGMNPQDAQRLLDAAKAQEGKQLKRPVRKEDSDGPDW